jgi:NAD(P)-dependent dehydrogenase (short-subunit alcohol dehydrogenase family)
MPDSGRSGFNWNGSQRTAGSAASGWRSRNFSIAAASLRFPMKHQGQTTSDTMSILRVTVASSYVTIADDTRIDAAPSCHHRGRQAFQRGDLMDLGLSNRLALVTGSTLGIGRAITEALIGEGARVIVNGRGEEAVHDAVAALSQRGTAYGVAADLSTAEGARKLLGGIAPLGVVDILVNNVGYFEVRKFADITDAEWLDMFQLNVMSGVRLARALFPGMLERNRGRVIFIGSDQSAKPNVDMAHYAMTKAAQVSIARSLAELTRGTRVTVNSVLAAPTWSEGVEAFLGKAARELGRTVDDLRAEYFRTTGANSLLQRWATPAEVAAQVVFLCSERASAINGAAQRVDGGIVRSLF